MSYLQGAEKNIRRNDKYYTSSADNINGERNRIAWCQYYREQLIAHGVIVTPADDVS